MNYTEIADDIKRKREMGRQSNIEVYLPPYLITREVTRKVDRRKSLTLEILCNFPKYTNLENEITSITIKKILKCYGISEKMMKNLD
jgi:hypothetical protein